VLGLGSKVRRGGSMIEASLLFIGAGAVHGRAWTSGARGCTDWRAPGMSAAIEHVAPLLLPVF
jgi:hypothetical protein